MKRPPETSVTTGPAQTSDLEAILELMCEAFQLPIAEARPIFYQDPYFKLENKRVLRVHGKVVSCLTIVEAQCHLGAGTIRVAGIAGVATVPEMRGQGFAARLLTATLHTLSQRGFALSALVPFSFSYYRRFGYEIVGTGYRYLTSPVNLFPFAESAHIRPALAADIPAMQNIYDTAPGDRTLYCLRDTRRWQYLLDNIKQCLVYAPNSWTVEGYLLSDNRTPAMPHPANPRVTLPSSLRILEMQAKTPAARRGLLGSLANQSEVDCLEYTASRDNLIENGLIDLLVPGEVGTALVSVEAIPYLMTRVLNLSSLLESLFHSGTQGTGEEGTGVLEIEMRDELLSANPARVKMEADETGVRITPCTENLTIPPLSDRISGNIRIWSQVLTGSLSGDDACALGLLQPNTLLARELACRWFPRRAPFLPGPDHF